MVLLHVSLEVTVLVQTLITVLSQIRAAPYLPCLVHSLGRYGTILHEICEILYSCMELVSFDLCPLPSQRSIYAIWTSLDRPLQSQKNTPIQSYHIQDFLQVLSWQLCLSPVHFGLRNSRLNLVPRHRFGFCLSALPPATPPRNYGVEPVIEQFLRRLLRRLNPWRKCCLDLRSIHDI